MYAMCTFRAAFNLDAKEVKHLFRLSVRELMNITFVFCQRTSLRLL